MTFGPDGVVLSVAVSEPRFTVGEKDALLASRRAERAPRGPHGRLLAEATDPAHQYDWVVPKPTRDFAEAKRRAAIDAYRKKYPDTDHTSLLWSVRLPDE